MKINKMAKMSFIFALIFSTIFTTNLFAESKKTDANKDKILNILSTEINREFKQLKKVKPPVYFLSYELTEKDVFSLSATLGGLEGQVNTHTTYLDVDVRVGSRELDNTRKVKALEFNSNNSKEIQVSLEEAPLKKLLWLETENAVKDAQQQYLKVVANNKTAAERSDNSDDFSAPLKKPSVYAEDLQPLDFDKLALATKVQELSALFKGHDFITSSQVSFNLSQETVYFVNTEKTKLKTTRVLGRLSYYAIARNKDGMEVERNKSYDVLDPNDLPSQEEITEDILKSIDELDKLQKAKPADTFHGPVILKNRATGVFFHEILGHRVEGHRQKDDDFGQTFTQKVGKQIISPLISVYDNPTLTHYNSIPLRGYYLYDNQGVPSQNTTLIENGVLKGFLMSREPIKNFSQSNGHGRKSPGKKVVSRMGNTIVKANKTVSTEELRKLLIDEIKKQNKPYGLIIEDISGGFTNTDTYSPQSFKVQPLLVYKVFPDGKPDEIIRGADIVGTPLVSFNKVIAAADDYDVFNGTCGAESGWVPVSAIAPSVLISEMEIEKVSKSYDNIPLLPPPSTETIKENK